MNSNEWQKVKKIFDAALELAPNRRKLFLDKSCGNDDGLRREVERLLERGFEQRDARIAFLKVEPKWNNLRDDPRFQDLLRRVGFPQ